MQSLTRCVTADANGKGGVHLQVQAHGCLQIGKCEALGRGWQNVFGLELGRDDHMVRSPY